MATPATVEQRVAVAGRELVISRPHDFEDLLTEEAFDDESLLPYWAHLWDSAALLADVAVPRIGDGDRVLDLGCGLGVTGIACALAGAAVTATDWSAQALSATEGNAARNGAVLETVLADWNEPAALRERAPWDLVLAADVVYEAKQIDVLLELLPLLGREVLLAEPGRSVAQPFFAAAEATWTVETVCRSHRPRVDIHCLRRHDRRIELETNEEGQ